MSMSVPTPRSLAPRDDELRDPTRDELFNGPTREKLPTAIQEMAEDETACTFCGVSYFVFSEVQELQATVKQYKKTFHEFVRFMERERKVSHDLKAQVVSLKKGVDDGVVACTTIIQKVGIESQRLRDINAQLTTQLHNAQRDNTNQQHEHAQLHAQWRLVEEERTMTSALTEQKLRNEILHLGSQLEKCRLFSTTQEAEWLASTERDQFKIKELELVVATTQSTMAAAERLVVTERDQLKQQLLAASERVEVGRETAKQLETQLRVVQHELQRVVASSDSERVALTQLHSDLATLKLQLFHHEKAQTAVAGERSDLHEQLDKANDLVQSLRGEVVTLEKKAEANAVEIEKHKHEYARELEKIRLEHGQAINRIQRDHQKALDELKQQQVTYLQCLQKQTSEAAASTNALQHALVEMEDKLRDADKHVAHTKKQLLESNDELQKLRLSHHNATARTQALERQLTDADREKRALVEELREWQRQHEQLQETSTRQLEEVQHKTKAQIQKVLDDHQRKLDGLQTKCNHLRRENEILTNERKARNPEDDPDDDARRRTTHQAWGDGSDSSRGERRASTRTTAGPTSSNNQDQVELEKLVESLRQTINQKDKEILLLQQTVHRECLERTSLLEKMKSGKVLPDLGPTVFSHASPVHAHDASVRKSSLTPRREPATTNGTDTDERDEQDTNENDPSQPKASLYERLRRAGQRKKVIRKP